MTSDKMTNNSIFSELRLLIVGVILCTTCRAWAQSGSVTWDPSQIFNEDVYFENNSYYVDDGDRKKVIKITFQRTGNGASSVYYKTNSDENLKTKVWFRKSNIIIIKADEKYVITKVVVNDPKNGLDLTYYYKDNNGTIAKTSSAMSWTNTKSGGDYSLNTFILANNNNAVTFKSLTIYYKPATPTGETLEISSAQWCTFYSEKDYFMPPGCTGYVVYNSGSYTDIKIDKQKEYIEGTLVKAGTPLLISGYHSYSPYQLYNNGNTASEMQRAETKEVTNLLRGTLEDAAFPTSSTDEAQVGKYYQFSYDSEGEVLGFYWQKDTNGDKILNHAKRCYLFLSKKSYGDLLYNTGAMSKVRGFSIDDMEDDEGEATPVADAIVDRTPSSNAIYNIQGQKVDSSYKGLVIKEGKKIWQ